MKIQVLRNNYKGLAPMHRSDLEAIEKLKLNTAYIVEVKEDRNPRFNAKFFAMLKMTLDNLPEGSEIKSVDDLKEDMKVRLGYYKIVGRTESGYQIIKTKSISFSKMDDLAFSDFYDRAITEICSFYLKGADPNDVESMILHYI